MVYRDQGLRSGSFIVVFGDFIQVSTEIWVSLHMGCPIRKALCETMVDISSDHNEVTIYSPIHRVN